ncbi:hypothetical protein [Thalassobacillus devorans]|uniref:hypothetical protein n=1 Tax=Thalassobacillus devorans TaxID=279813 RepID=UPI00048ED003|nr:hypothetical protein [Thalassobacillus devorans]
MGIIVMFMLLASVTPFLFLQMKKTIFALVQTVLLVGMWLYFFEVVFQSAPAAFSIPWIMFYASLFVSEAGWVMFIIRIVKTSGTVQESYQ